MSVRQQLPPGPVIPWPVRTALLWAYPFRFLRACQRKYGPVFTLRVGSHPPLVFVCDREEMQTVLRADERLMRPGDGAAAVEPIVGLQSFMLAHGTPHRNVRRALTPVIGATVVERHAATMRDGVRRAIEGWPVGAPIELHTRLRALTLELILRVIVGSEREQPEQFFWRLHASVLAMLDVTSSPVLTEPFLRHGPGKVAWSRFLRRRRVVDALLHELIDKVAEDPPADGLLARLMAVRGADGSSPSRQQVRDNVMSMILAGHETTASQLAWAIQLLARCPAAQAQLAAEARAGGEDTLVRATIAEVLRHRCAFVFAIPRTLIAPVELGGYLCEPPAQIVPCIYLLHHDARHHSSPDMYIWDRFLGAAHDPQTWLPWGGGPRRCPGRHLAQLEMATILQSLLASRTIAPAGRKIERPRWRGVIVAPQGRCRVVLQVRP